MAYLRPVPKKPMAPGFSFELTPKVVMDLGSMTPLLRKMITL